MMETRLQLLRKKLAANKVEAFLVNKPENYRYLTGFTGSNAILVITEKRAVLVTDFRYFEQAEKEAVGCQVVMGKDGLLGKLAEVVAETGLKRIGIESDFVTLKTHQDYLARLKEVELKPLGNMVEGLRIVKSEEEIARIKQAAHLADQAYEHILPLIRPGVTEQELALELEFFLRRSGAEKVGFDLVVASGERSAMPHALASSKKVKSGEFVLIDLGAVWQGYHSDLSRTVIIGKATEKQHQIYQIVQIAQKTALESIRPGIRGLEADWFARDYITSQGYGENFGHGLGHGLGLEIHEAPRLAPTVEEELAVDMVFTVEPAIYLTGFGGVRIEDTVVLREGGVEVLTRSPREFLEI